jgi:hypothetical protein
LLLLGAGGGALPPEPDDEPAPEEDDDPPDDEDEEPALAVEFSLPSPNSGLVCRCTRTAAALVAAELPLAGVVCAAVPVE